MKVKKRNLLLLASLVWMAAGFNVLKIGVECYIGNLSALNIALSAVIFIIFWFMVFGKLVKKHTKRISAYIEEKQFFLNFFDVKSFIIMALMITLGITIRKLNLWPQVWIAVFYTGLGSALFLAGILFGVNYFLFSPTRLD